MNQNHSTNRDQPQNVPVGYKQTEIGVLPQDWDVKVLRENVTTVIDNRGKTPPYSDAADVELIETSSISFVGSAPDYTKVTKFVSYLTYQTWFRDHPKKDDLLVSTVGEYSGASAMLAENRGTIAQNLIALRIKTVVPIFVFYWTRSPSYYQQLRQVMMSQAQPSLRVPWLLGFKIPLPPTKTEQRSIATALSDADTYIESLEKLIAKKCAIKKGVMQELLTGKRRLPGFSGEWEETTLGEIGECIIGLTYKPENVVEHGLMVLRSSNVQNGQLTYDDNVYVNLQVDDHLYAQHGDILVCVRNGSRALIGKCAVIDSNAIGLTFGAFMSVYRTKYWRYVHHLFQGDNIQRQIRDNIGATINQITNKDMKALYLRLPPDDEQQAIADVLSDIDADITAHEAKLSKARLIKQGMMQELLTGRIRLI